MPPRGRTPNTVTPWGRPPSTLPPRGRPPSTLHSRGDHQVSVSQGAPGPGCRLTCRQQFIMRTTKSNCWWSRTARFCCTCRCSSWARQRRAARPFRALNTAGSNWGRDKGHLRLRRVAGTQKPCQQGEYAQARAPLSNPDYACARECSGKQRYTNSNIQAQGSSVPGPPGSTHRSQACSSAHRTAPGPHTATRATKGTSRPLGSPSCQH